MNTDSPADPLEAGLAIAQALESKNVPYAIGGALAYGLWGVPRATIDVDINVFTDEHGLAPVVAALDSLGITIDLEQAKSASAQRGMFSARFHSYRIDIFTSSIDFCREAENRRVAFTVSGQQTWFLSAETLAVFKLLYFRAKDIVDLQRMIAVQGKRLDVNYVRKKIVEMMGADDERVIRWDELVRDFGGG